VAVWIGSASDEGFDMSNSQKLYERDFYGWANEQAGLLRAGRLSEADIDNIAEEIESIGKNERNQLTNDLAVLLAHLLKWHFQPGLRGNSWRLTVREQRRRMDRVMAQNPGLRPELDAVLADAYGDALLIAERETGLLESAFPPACPWAFAQIVDPDFWPETI
jgi:hypothetical protein